jgi:hypothetical protein
MGGVNVQIHVFLTLTLVGGEWSVSHLSHFTLSKEAFPVPIEEKKKRLGGFQNQAGQCGQQKASDPAGIWTQASLVIQAIASHSADCVIPAPNEDIRGSNFYIKWNTFLLSAAGHSLRLPPIQQHSHTCHTSGVGAFLGCVEWSPWKQIAT